MKKIILVFTLLALFLIPALAVQAALPSSVSVEIKSSFDNDNRDVSHTAQTKAVGDVLSLDASVLNGTHTFAYWVINDVVRQDLDATSNIRVQSSMKVHAVFYASGEHAVIFADSNGKFISLDYVLNGQDATAPSTVGFDKPGMVINATTPWSTLSGQTALTSINSSRVYFLQYDNDVASVTLTVNGGTATPAAPNRNEVVTVEANDTVNFKYWKDAEGNVLSFNPTFSFTASKSMTITAETVDATKTAASMVSMIEITGIRSGYETFVGRFELQGDDEVIEWGFIYSNKGEEITLDTAGVVIAKSNNAFPVTNEFIMSFELNHHITTRAYAIIDNGVELVTVYSDFYTPKLIEDIRSASGSVKTSGIVTGISGTKYVFVSQRDGEAAIALFNPTIPSGLAVGDEVIINGTMGTFNGMIQINAGASLVIMSTGNALPAAVDLGLELIAFTTSDQHRRFTVRDLVVTAVSSQDITVSDGTISIKVRVDTTAFTDLMNHINVLSVGDIVDIENMHMGWFNGAQFFINDVSELTYDQSIVEPKIRAELDGLYDAKSFNEGSNFAPVTSLYGYAISWAYNPSGLIVDGKLFDVTEDTLVSMTATFNPGSGNVNHVVDFTVKFVEEGSSPTLLYSYNFLDGGSSSNSAYANTNLSTNVSFAADNPGGTSGTTNWIANYANLSLTTGTRLGGKLVSVETGANNESANIRTNFTYSETITKFEILGATTFGTAGNVTKIFLQTSTDGTTWTTVAFTTTKTGDLVFDGLNIAAGNYFRVLVELTASTTNSGLSFTGIKVTGYPS